MMAPWLISIPALPSDLDRRNLGNIVDTVKNHLKNHQCSATQLLDSSPYKDIWNVGCTGELYACLLSPRICQSDHRELFDKLGAQQIKQFKWNGDKNPDVLEICSQLHAKRNGDPDTPLTVGLTLADGHGSGF